MTNTKPYWSTLKMLLNNEKIAGILPLSHQNNYVKAFKVGLSPSKNVCYLLN